MIFIWSLKIIHKNKIQNINALSNEDRFGYFIRRVSDFEVIWGLYLDGWAAAKSDDGVDVMPFWPEPEFAKICARGVWEEHEPQSILLADFLNKWLPGMEKDQMHIAVFPIEGHQGTIMEPSELKREIDEELEQYE
jgi:hypothetical protein